MVTKNGLDGLASVNENGRNDVTKIGAPYQAKMARYSDDSVQPEGILLLTKSIEKMAK